LVDTVVLQLLLRSCNIKHLLITVQPPQSSQQALIPHLWSVMLDHLHHPHYE